jgi:hypothetical protein
MGIKFNNDIATSTIVAHEYRLSVIWLHETASCLTPLRCDGRHSGVPWDASSHADAA